MFMYTYVISSSSNYVDGHGIHLQLNYKQINIHISDARGYISYLIFANRGTEPKSWRPLLLTPPLPSPSKFSLTSMLLNVPAPSCILSRFLIRYLDSGLQDIWKVFPDVLISDALRTEQNPRVKPADKESFSFQTWVGLDIEEEYLGLIFTPSLLSYVGFCYNLNLINTKHLKNQGNR